MDRVNAAIAFEEPRFVKFSPVLVPLPGVQRSHSHTAFKGVNANPPHETLTIRQGYSGRTTQLRVAGTD